MTKGNRFFSSTLLLTGIVIGIASQRISQSRDYTDQWLKPIENSSIVKSIRNKISDPSTSVIHHEPYITTNYVSQSKQVGQPQSNFILHKKNFSIAYDAQHRNPAWVFEHLTTDNLKHSLEYPYANLKEDENIPFHLRTTLADYKSRSLERGHMAAISNHSLSVDAMNDTFYLSNICPQCPQLNQDYWPKLEEHVRNLAKDYAHVYAITGPLYLPYNEKDGRFVKYRVIGPSDVAVPSHFFKVLILENEQGQKESIAYILPNQEIAPSTPLNEFKTPLKEVEKKAGMLFQ